MWLGSAFRRPQIGVNPASLGAAKRRPQPHSGSDCGPAPQQRDPYPKRVLLAGGTKLSNSTAWAVQTQGGHRGQRAAASRMISCRGDVNRHHLMVRPHAHDAVRQPCPVISGTF